MLLTIALCFSVFATVYSNVLEPVNITAHGQILCDGKPVSNAQVSLVVKDKYLCKHFAVQSNRMPSTIPLLDHNKPQLYGRQTLDETHSDSEGKYRVTAEIMDGLTGHSYDFSLEFLHSCIHRDKGKTAYSYRPRDGLQGAKLEFDAVEIPDEDEPFEFNIDFKSIDENYGNDY